jgi:hypothetical protein
MEVICQFGSEINVSGSAVSALVRCLPSSSSSMRWEVHAQASGHVYTDERWSKLSPEALHSAFPRETALPLDEKVKIPRVSGMHDSHCVYITPRRMLEEPDRGCLLQFDIPDDAIPSFRGLLGTTMYFITLTVRSISDHNENPGNTNSSVVDEENGLDEKTLHFPFVVSGLGSSLAKQYVRYSDLVSYKLSSFPAEHCFLPIGASSSSAEGGGDRAYHRQNLTTSSNSSMGRSASGSMPELRSERELEQSHTQASVNVYTIRDIGIVCLITSPSRICPGEALSLYVDFSTAEQSCRGIRARLLMSEQRIDGSQVQDKVIASQQKMTSDAVGVTFRLELCNDLPCSFVSPLQRIVYRIDFEFLASESNSRQHIDENNTTSESNKNEEGEEEAFSWSADIFVEPGYTIRPNRANLMACLEPTAFLARQQLGT